MNRGLSFKEILRHKKEELKKAVAVVFIVGVALMILGENMHSEENQKPQIASAEYSTDYYSQTEERLEEILACVSGAGKVKVMITFSQSSEKVAAQEIRREEQSEDGDSSYESTYVLKDNNDGGTDAVVLTEYMPLPQGVLIVAQGGDNIYVKQALSRAAAALFDVPAHKIEVLKMEG